MPSHTTRILMFFSLILCVDVSFSHETEDRDRYNMLKKILNKFEKKTYVVWWEGYYTKRST